MKLKALSQYDGDKDTRFGDCILIYNNSLFLMNCGPINLKRGLYIVKCRAMPFSLILLRGKLMQLALTSKQHKKCMAIWPTRPQICRLLSGTSCFRRVEFLKWGM